MFIYIYRHIYMHMILDWQKHQFRSWFVGLDPWNRLDRCEGSPWAVVLCCSRSVPWCGAIPGLSRADALLQGMQLSQGAAGSRWSIGEFHHALDLDLHLHGLNRQKLNTCQWGKKTRLHPSLVSTSTFLTFGLSRLQAPVPRSWASQMVAWPPPSTTGPTSHGVICPSSRPAIPMTSAGATGRHPPVSTLVSMDMEVDLVEWSFKLRNLKKSTFFFSSSFWEFLNLQMYSWCLWNRIEQKKVAWMEEMQKSMCIYYI